MIAKKMTLLAVVLAVVLGSGAALAGDDDDGGGQTRASDASAEVKMAREIVDREPVDEATSFAAGDRVWAWSRITGAANTSVKHVWKRDGKVEWTATLPVKSNRWTTRSRRALRAGQYVVEVQAEDGSVLGSVSFSAQ